jgi:hypothetical protein
MPAKIKEVQCKICGAWVPLADLQNHIAKEHSDKPILTPQSAFGVR